MTCIVGMIDKGAVVIGGDSAGVSGLDLTVRSDQKVFSGKDHSFVMGFTSSFRMGQLLRYKFQKPPHIEGVECFEYMATAFVDAVRQCLKDGGYAKKNNEEESGGTFLVGYRGRLFRIESDYQVGETTCGYDACGCAQDVARGSLFSTRMRRIEDRVLSALQAAEQWSASVRRPFKIIRLEK